MVKLYDSGVWLVNGRDIVEDGPEAAAAIGQMTGSTAVSREEASKETMAYSILEKHNTSGNMDDLQIKFDKLTSHDITFVGIIQTARASGLEKFPVPYVLTNCHNSLCAVGGTWLFGVKLGLLAVGTYIGLASDECVRAVGMYLRWRSGKWKEKRLIEEDMLK